MTSATHGARRSGSCGRQLRFARGLGRRHRVSLTKVKLRNLRTGQVFDKTYRGGDKVDEPDLEMRAIQFLYGDDDGFHFMDTASYDQIVLSADDVGDAPGYLTEGMEGIRSFVFNGKVISIDLPNDVNLRITQTNP